MVGIQGEQVRISFIGSTANNASVAVTLYDALNNVRPLAANEHLIMDRLEGNVSTAVVNVLSAPAGTSSTYQSTLIASLLSTMPVFRPTKEGIAVPRGITPSVLCSDASVIYLTGGGRIVAESSTTRPTWQAALR